MEINGKKYNFNEKKTDINFQDLGVQDSKLKNIFDYFDLNKDGKLSGNELAKAFGAFTSMDNSDGVADSKLSDDEIKMGILAFPKEVRISIDAMKSFIIRLSTVNQGKNLANDIHNQISGPSLNSNTIEKLKQINKNNVIEIINEYTNISKDETLASAIDNEWGLDIKEVKQYICKPLITRAKEAGIQDVYFSQYLEIDNIQELNNFINTTVEKIKSKEAEKIKSDFQQAAPSQTKNLIRAEVRKYKGVVKESDVDYEHWTKVIDTVAEKYNVPQEIITAIIGKETHGTFKSVNSSNGSGPMQITTISVNGFFPGAKGNWNTLFNKMDSDLLKDILYEKDANGKPTNKLRFSSPKELRDACATDHELGVMVGLLTFEMKYVEAVAGKKFGRSNYKTVPLAIEALKNNTLNMSEKEIQECVQIAMKNYNGSSLKESYARDVVDSLKVMNFPFETFNPLIE